MKAFVVAAAVLMLALPRVAEAQNVSVKVPFRAQPWVYAKMCPGFIRQTYCNGKSGQFCCNRCASAVRKAGKGGSVKIECARWGERVACPRNC
jgi:hypothetical protein